MTSFRPKLWTSISAAVILSATGVAACHQTGGEETTSAAEPAPAVGEGDEAGAKEAYAGIPAESKAALRLAHLRGFFLIAAAQTEGADYAAALAGQGMLEVYDPQVDAFKATGVDEAVLRKAADTGAPADLGAALATLNAAIDRVGGNDAAVATGLTSIASGLYSGVVSDGAVDTVEYQHSLGAALSLKELADHSSDPAVVAARPDIEKFVAMWPAAEAPETVTPTDEVAAQASRIELALS